MRITYLYQFFVTPEKPGSHRCYEFSSRLARLGHDVTVVSSDIYGNQGGWRQDTINGFRVYRYPVFYSNRLSFIRRMFAFVKFLVVASHKLLKIDSDVIFASSTPLTVCIPAVLTARIRKIPLVFEVRDLWPETAVAVGVLKNPFAKWLAKRLERFAYRNSARVVALSAGMAEGVAKAGYPQDRIRVIPNSCDLDRFSSDPTACARFWARHAGLPQGRLVLYAGSMGRVTDVAWMVQLAKACETAAPDLRFLVFGEGSEESKTRELARELGVLNINYFQFSRIPKDQIVDAFLAADVVTSLCAPIPELEKNSANKFFDGLSAGKPVVINYGGWQADLLREAGAGLVLSRSPEIAAQELSDFLADPLSVERAGNAARALAEEKFARGKLTSELDGVLREAVEQGT